MKNNNCYSKPKEIHSYNSVNIREIKRDSFIRAKMCSFSLCGERKIPRGKTNMRENRLPEKESDELRLNCTISK